MLSAKRSGARRWPRGQKFTLSPAGVGAAESYRNAVLGARSSGRAGLESALSAWAAPLRIEPGDGVILAELSGKRIGLPELCSALEAAGIAPDEVRAGIARLIDAGIVEPIPLASQLEARRTDRL